ncbi:MAG: C45 family autoproteolytic acyltransferase/hydrolase [Micromonosporaceae bacterium]
MRIHEYRSTSREPAARGRAFGERWAGPVARAATAYRGHFRAFGIDDATVAAVADASYQAVLEWGPSYAEELRGIADGAGLPVREISMLNARTEVLAAVAPSGDGECSTLVRADASLLSAQTWDWHADLVPDALVWRYDTGPGHWVKTFTEPGMLAKIGVNSRGLAAHFNILHHRSDHAGGGVPVHVIARRILDEAGSVDDAYRIAASAPVSASTVLTVAATASGTTGAGSIEISPAGTALVSPGADGWLVHTNHFLDPELGAGGVNPDASTTIARYDHLRQVRSGLRGGSLPEVAELMCGAPGAAAPICVTEDPDAAPVDQWRTLLTVLLDPVGGTMEYWPGSPHQAAGAAHAHRF